METNETGDPSDLTILDVNSAFERIAGMKKDVLAGRSISELFPGVRDKGFDWIGELGRVGLHGGGFEKEEFIVKSGRWVVFNVFLAHEGLCCCTL